MMKKPRSLEGNDSLKIVVKNPANYEALFPNLVEDFTRNEGFYVRSHFSTPKISLTNWRLEVCAERSKSRKFLSYDQLRSLPMITLPATLECAGNGRINFPRRAAGEVTWGNCAVSTAEWRGVPLSEIIKAVGIDQDDVRCATEFLFIGVDGSTDDKVALESPTKFVRALPPDKALSPSVIVAVDMNGSQLPLDHGFPARLVVPGWYAMASVKWLKQIVLRTSEEKFSGHFNGVKYVYEIKQDGKWIKEPVTSLRVKSLIVSPTEGSRLAIGDSISITGKAWSGFGKIVKVEVDTGQGWQEATLEKSIGEYAWRNWSCNWSPKSGGLVTLRVRATDEKGNVQPEIGEDNRYLYGYNGIHKIRVNVV